MSTNHGATMTRAERNLLRSAIDAAVRQRVGHVENTCRGCRVELRDDFDRPRYVDGCLTCAERRSKRLRRAGEWAASIHTPALPTRKYTVAGMCPRSGLFGL